MRDDSGDVQFFITPQHPCSYLPRRQAQTLFFDPRQTVTEATYQTLTEHGFRRSGSHLYRPHCAACSACVPTRIPVATFTPRRTQRRTQKANADLTVRVESAHFSDRYYELYEKYVVGRHSEGDMFPPSPDQFRSFLLSPWSSTFFLCSYAGDTLVSVAVTDRQPRGLSAIYTFFDPDLDRRGLGVFSILQQVALARELELPYVYLGYWIAECEKMRYKTQYRPVELLVAERWVPLT